MTEQETVREIESKIFSPFLKQGLEQSKEDGYSLNDTLLGAANAYMNMLVQVLGKDQASRLLQDQLNFLNSQS